MCENLTTVKNIVYILTVSNFENKNVFKQNFKLLHKSYNIKCIALATVKVILNAV